MNPIHLDEEIAKKMGLPGRIAHGMLTSAWLADRALQEFPAAKGWRIVRKQDRFKAMAYLGDTVSISGKIRSQEDHRVILDLEAIKQTGEITATSVIELERNS